jgi:uncharacterized paraquat-inducible protein A
VNPIHIAAIMAALGKRRACRKCGTVQTVRKLDEDGRYRCKHCHHLFTQADLKQEN